MVFFYPSNPLCGFLKPRQPDRHRVYSRQVYVILESRRMGKNGFLLPIKPTIMSDGPMKRVSLKAASNLLGKLLLHHDLQDRSIGLYHAFRAYLTQIPGCLFGCHTYYAIGWFYVNPVQ